MDHGAMTNLTINSLKLLAMLVASTMYQIMTCNSMWDHGIVVSMAGLYHSGYMLCLFRKCE